MSLLLVLFLTIFGLTIALEPLEDFCRLHSHRTAVVDRKLYVDGGFVNWAPVTADPVNETNTWLRVADFDLPHLSFPNQTTVAKNETVPSTSGGILWPDTANKVVYAYGGEQESSATADERLWYYDILYDTWNVSKADGITSISSAAWGAGTTVFNKGLGYYYGGWPTNTSNSDTEVTTALPTMVVYNMLESKFSTQSGPDQVGRAEGVMLYVPAGDAGILIYFGGIQVINGTQQPLPMSEIFVYDIANSRWYKQTTSGAELPGSRRRFCAGVVWAEDRSSYNIYLYGGASVGKGTGYGDVWILSLPSFTWIKYFPTSDDSAVKTPHHSLSCDVYENSQMIIMGGHFTNSTDCDVPAIYGQHGLHLGRVNPEDPKWAAFNASLTTYNVPPEITNAIGGDAAGNATITAPKDGWQTGDLGIVFAREYAPALRSPTRPVTTPIVKSSSTNEDSLIGPAVGGAVGGLLFVIAVGVSLFFLHRRQRRIKEMTPIETRYHIARPSPHIELPGALARSYSSTSLSHARGPSELDDHKQQVLLVPVHELPSVRSPLEMGFARQSPRQSKFKEEDGIAG